MNAIPDGYGAYLDSAPDPMGGWGEVVPITLNPAIITATPYVWRDPATIPPRPWIYGRWFLRGTIACVVAPGGAGKSTVLAGTALALVTGRDLLAKRVWNGPKRVWLWNLEDDGDELARAIQGAALHHGIAPDDLAGGLFVDSGMEGAGLCTAVDTPADGFKLLEPVYGALTAELTRRGIDVLIVDPFVSSHTVDENSNVKIDAVAKAWARVAKAANCCIILAHHASKAGSAEVTVMSARGAVALTSAARCTLTLNRLSNDEAERLGISDDDRRRIIGVTDDKHNRAPAEKADWVQLMGIDLGNGNGDQPSDSIAVAVPFTLPDAFDGVTAGDLYRVQSAIAAGEWRKDPQASAWAGKAVADVLGLDAEAKGDKARIKSMLRTWIANKALCAERRPDHKAVDREWLVVGEWAQPSTPSTP
jgi:hypothetical protein